MVSTPDFLSLSWLEADQYLQRCRQRLNDCLPDSSKISGNSVVFLAVMDGAADHKRAHPGFSPFHYVQFSDTCRRLITEHGGKALPCDLDGIVDYLACGWFEEDGIAAAAAAVEIREHFREMALVCRGTWVHERHAVASIGRNEYAAFRLLQMSMRDKTMVDPLVWQGLSAPLQGVLRACGVQQPDLEHQKSRTAELVDSNVDLARTAYLRLRTEGIQATAQREELEELANLS